MEELLNQMTELLNDIQDDAAKFEEKGNKAAGTRIRKGLQEIKTVAQDLRKEISEMKNA